MALVLGLELDVFLREIGHDLKGKTKVNYVDQDTLVHAVSYQNKVILAMQEQLLRMQESERSMQRTLFALKEKVEYCEKYTMKVDDMEQILGDKVVPLLDKVNEVVQEHDLKIDGHEMARKKHEAEYQTFKGETKQGMSESNTDITNIRGKIRILPQTIVISSRQVVHGIDVGDGTRPRLAENEEKEFLGDIIARQMQHARQQDDSIKDIEVTLHNHVSSQDALNDTVGSNLRGLVEWKEEQKSVDVVTMRVNQDTMKSQLDSHEKHISTKMNKDDVTKKLDLQFKEIVDHLQSAMETVEKDEGDFKSITDTLSTMCKTLRENKADKSEINALRKQFIENQIETEDGIGGISPIGSTMDNESIRQILMDYPTHENMTNFLTTKIDRTIAVQEFTRIDRRILQLAERIRAMLTLSTDETRNELKKGFDFQSIESEGVFLADDLDHTENIYVDDESRNESINLYGEARGGLRTSIIQDGQPCKGSRTADDARPSTGMKKKQSVPDRKRSQKDGSFPLSNVLSGTLSEIPPNEEGLKRYHTQHPIDGSDSNSFLQTKSIRPSSAPIHCKDNKNALPKPLTKKNSLPAILTSISKSMISRSRLKEKNKSTRDMKTNIHKGSFQVVLNVSSDKDLPPVSEDIGKDGTGMSGRRIRSKDIVIRTSIG